MPWHSVELFHLDEYLGLAATHPASFRRYLQERLIGPAGIARVHLIDGEGDPELVCQAVGREIAAAPIDVAFVGIGENGHLAFNDPPADFDTREPYLVVELDEACRRQQVGEGWFQSLDAGADARDLDVGEPDSRSRRILCIVPDRRKAEAVRRVGARPGHAPRARLDSADACRHHAVCRSRVGIAAGTGMRLRWYIGGLLFLSTVINYIDRQTLSVLAPYIKTEFQWTNTDFAMLIIAFRVAYAGGQTVSGRLLDRFGTRAGLTVSVAFYSTAAMLTSLATGFRSLAAFRFLLGLGESANWPGATKAVSEWFPAEGKRLGGGAVRLRVVDRRRHCALPGRWASTTTSATGGRPSSSPARWALAGWCCGGSSITRQNSIRASRPRSARTSSPAATKAPPPARRRSRTARC